jgi:hypothetical protein
LVLGALRPRARDVPATRRFRARATYLALALATIVFGLGVHSYGGVLRPGLRDFVGDALWAVMIMWWVGAIAPGASRRIRILAALVICFGVEASQLYHTATLDALRTTVVGQLVLGSGFDPRDLVAYTLGVLIAGLIDRAVVR